MDNDQMFKICECLEMNEDQDLSFLSSEGGQKAYMENILNESKAGKSL